MKKAGVVVALVLFLLFAGLMILTRQDSKPLPSATPLVSPVSEILPNYTDPTYGYKLYIPEGMTAEKQSDESTLFYPKDQPQGAGPTNFIYVSVVPPQMRDVVGEIYNYNPTDFNKLIALESIGDSVNLGTDDMAEWFTYTVVDEVDFGTGKIKNFENTKPWEFPAGTTENRFIYGAESNIYILGYYTGGETGATIDPREAYKSILSFKEK